MTKRNEIKYKDLREFNRDRDLITEYISSCFKERGFELVDKYKDGKTPLVFNILKGKFTGLQGKKGWTAFTVSKEEISFSTLTEESKEKYIISVCEVDGYKVLDIQRPIKTSNKIKLLSPRGNEWETPIYSFIKGTRCPLDNNKSWGERCIATILSDNSIPFQHGYTIRHPDNSIQYMDFYIEYRGKKYNIEYNGRQHYKTDENSFFVGVETQVERDNKKRIYCKDNSINHIEIPYTVVDVNDIAKKINEYITVDINKTYEVPITILHDKFTDEDVVEYYKTHTCEETSNKFRISTSTVCKIFYRKGNKKIVQKHYDLDFKRKVVDYYKIHTLRDTARKFNINNTTVLDWSRNLGYIKREEGVFL